MADERTRPGGPGWLQFETAEYSKAPPATPPCGTCHEPIHDVYYDVGGATTCERCRHDLELPQSVGGGFSRLARATLFGIAAAIASSVAWYGIRKLTGYEFGILAIGVGLLVGGAVRSGARRRGGWRYQALAMFLTYNAIVVTYLPDIVQGLGSPAEAAPLAGAPGATAPATASRAPLATATAAPVAASAAPAARPEASAVPLGAAGIALGVAFLLLIAYAAPFLVVFQDPSALMGLAIIAIGLWEAWKMNRRTALEITGPHRIAPVRNATS